MKPFDLEKALAGEPVVTRDGQPVKIGAYNKDVAPNCQLVGWINGGCYTWYSNGIFDSTLYESRNDLFMATKTVKKEGWVNLHKTRDRVATVTGGRIYDDLHIAIQSLTHGAIATVKIEWEEEI